MTERKFITQEIGSFRKPDNSNVHKSCLVKEIQSFKGCLFCKAHEFCCSLTRYRETNTFYRLPEVDHVGKMKVEYSSPVFDFNHQFSTFIVKIHGFFFCKRELNFDIVTVIKPVIFYWFPPEEYFHWVRILIYFFLKVG